MYIVDKNKDFYDHFSYIYGIDKKVVFDRRGSKNITNADIASLVESLGRLTHEPFLLLEIGDVQYLLKASNLKKVGLDFRVDLEVLKIYRENKHHFASLLSIRKVGVGRFGYGSSLKKNNLTGIFSQDISRISEQYSYNNIILKNTNLTSIIDGETIWKELQNYLSSLNNDKDINLKMSEEEKAEQYGFDRVTSFRNPIR